MLEVEKLIVVVQFVNLTLTGESRVPKRDMLSLQTAYPQSNLLIHSMLFAIVVEFLVNGVVVIAVIRKNFSGQLHNVISKVNKVGPFRGVVDVLAHCRLVGRCGDLAIVPDLIPVLSDP